MEELPGRPTYARGLKVAAAALLVLAALSAVGLVRAVRRSFRHTCEVCVGYHGRTVCREAVAATRDEAVSIALDRACTFLASDPAEHGACVEAPPMSADCRED